MARTNTEACRQLVYDAELTQGQRATVRHMVRDVARLRQKARRLQREQDVTEQDNARLRQDVTRLQRDLHESTGNTARSERRARQARRLLRRVQLIVQQLKGDRESGDETDGE